MMIKFPILTMRSRRFLPLAAGAFVLALAGCAPVAIKKPAPEPVDLAALVWPAPPEQKRISFIRTISSSADIGVTGDTETGRLIKILLGKEDEKGSHLLKPYGVHADKDGRIFVADTGWGRVLMFDVDNKEFEIWGEGGEGALRKPVGVTSDSEGRIYVTDAIAKRVVVYDRDGNFLHAFGGKENFETPAGIAINEALGRIYVADTKKHRVSVWTLEGEPVATIGEGGSEPGQFNYPTNLAVDREGKLYVVDTMNFRVQIFDADGEFESTFGSIGDSYGDFSRPKGIAVDSDGHVYVVDAAFSNFQIFNPDGELLLFVGSTGSAPGQFRLPAGAYIDSQDRIYVADQFNYRVQVFQYYREGSEAAPRSAPEAGESQGPAGEEVTEGPGGDTEPEAPAGKE